MKAITVSTVVALLVAVPLLFKKREPQPVEIRKDERGTTTDEDRRYDVDDFLTS